MILNERPVEPELKDMLVNNESFQYAHLIKFERPSRPDSTTGLVSTSKVRYTYLTDASRNIVFDDGSADSYGTLNGPQTYIANKVLSVGVISEQTKATTSSTSIVLDGNSLGANVEATVNISSAGSNLWDITFPMFIDLVQQGFREGDKVSIVYIGTAYVANITSFREGNVLRVSKVDVDLPTGVALPVTVSLSSEEIISILLDKNVPEYASFINREVYIYCAYFKDGVQVGTPLLMFRGIISNVSFEDTDSAIKVSWGLTSHWGDFSQVRGRITSDSSHRALNENGVPQPSSALKPIYAYDKGFAHSENSINMLSKYVVQVEKYTTKSKKGVLGIGAKVKTSSYFSPEDRYTNLDFQLQAKSIPVVYGVRNLNGVPVFSDTLKDDSGTVYVVYTLCEGEIGGVYDVYIEGNSLICNDKADYDARAAQTTDNAVELLCRGRADRGDALGGESALSETSVSYYDTEGNEIKLDAAAWEYLKSYFIGYNPPTVTNITPTGTGLIDGDTLSLQEPQEILIDFFSGKPGQKAASSLVQLAYDQQFKIQTSYWEGPSTGDYWGPNHRLLDTAYVVVKVKIAEGETTIPSLEFITRGKVIDCYNYDYSYKHDSTITSESSSNFPLGSVVSLYRSSDNALLDSNLQIIDKWTFLNPDGTQNTRFRFSSPPSLSYTNGVPAVTKFYMQNASGQRWTMVTYNHSEYSGTVTTEISATVTSVTDEGGFVGFNYSANIDMTIEGDPIEASPNFSIVNTDNSNLSSGALFPYAVMAGTVSSTKLITKYSTSTYGPEASTLVGKKLLSKNTIKLPSGASSTDDAYKGMLLEVTKINSAGKKLVEQAEIIGYDGTSRIATIDIIWANSPTIGDSIRIFQKYSDSRVSINLAIQTLDYITSTTYGRGLDPYKDLYLPSWLETARRCDTKSDVTIEVSSGTLPTVNAVYRYPSSGDIIWQGTVNSISGQYLTFGEVIGKLTNKWNSWKSWNTNEIVYNSNSVYKVTVAGIKSTEPTHTSGTVDGLEYLSSITLTKVSGTGGVTLTLPTNGNPVRALKAGKQISGYSLYDSDSINYWRLTGWDGHDQRYVTKHQGNLTIDTSLPLLENINSLLEHFNGILTYTAGQYHLSLEEREADTELEGIRHITSDDIIGKIQLSDEGVRSAFNSLTAAFADPANKFEARNIGFFNSEYLKADRNVPKKGNLSIPGITNYYNARLLSDSFLNKSRFGLTISMTVRYHGVLFLAGRVIEVSYPRYSWLRKRFRIETLNYQPDGLVDIVAKEYDGSFYSLEKVSSSGGSGPTTQTNRIVSVGPPSDLIVTSADTLDELLNGVELRWVNHQNANSTNVFTEIYASMSPFLNVDVTSILSNVCTTSQTAINFVPGMPLFPVNSSNGLVAGAVYYVLSATSNTFTVTDTKGGLTPVTLTDGAGLTLKVRTADLLATVPVPTTSYIDNVANESSGRVEKYYWIRHKVV